MSASLMEDIVSLAKRRGFIFPSSEIYGGLAAVYDYGPLGALFKNNVRRRWWRTMVQERDDIVGLESAILMNPNVWVASGHVQGFTDPLVDCKSCKRRFRADHLLAADSLTLPGMKGKPVEMSQARCPECGGALTDVRQFNLMFKTHAGPVEDESSIVYLRPETAQGIFVNFHNVVEASRKRIPFGIAQSGKAFRNEITTGNFTFRTREFEQMEMEFFVAPGTDDEWFEYWKNFMMDWFTGLGIQQEKLRFYEHPKEKLSHYSKRTVDLEYEFPWGWGELWGCANRTDYDLKQHAAHSGKDLSFFDETTGKRFVPFVIEPALGLDRAALALLVDAYQCVKGGRTTTTRSNKEEEVVLRLHPSIAPVTVAVLPLAKKEPLAKIAKEIKTILSRDWMVDYDDTGSIGRRYRRQDEIGTPYCVTVDFDSVSDHRATVRHRDSMQQERVEITTLSQYIHRQLEL